MKNETNCKSIRKPKHAPISIITALLVGTLLGISSCSGNILSQPSPNVLAPVSVSTENTSQPTQTLDFTATFTPFTPQEKPSSTMMVSPSPAISTPQTSTPTPMVVYQAPGGRVTISIPAEGRYIVIGDSLSYGSTLSGSNTYEDICDNRWPYVEQLAAETGIYSTASLDRGDSMKTPFSSQTQWTGKVVYFCEPPDGTPTLSTAVPGSNTSEWLADLLFYPALTDNLNRPEDRVVLFLIGADIFAAKIGKTPISADEYEQNVGKMLSYLASFKKIIYVALIPHVRVGSFISNKELEGTNSTIDDFNKRLKKIIKKNGYQDAEKGEWIGFGDQQIIQDGFELWIPTIQPGPQLDLLSDTKLGKFYSKDGLHLHAEGYNLIGKAWAQALQAPVRITKSMSEK